jgi:hypothetical protein
MDSIKRARKGPAETGFAAAQTQIERVLEKGGLPE